jgi:hypothetical protein
VAKLNGKKKLFSIFNGANLNVTKIVQIPKLFDPG